jgi:hypothetical protein
VGAFWRKLANAKASRISTQKPKQVPHSNRFREMQSFLQSLQSLTSFFKAGVHLESIPLQMQSSRTTKELEAFFL